MRKKTIYYLFYFNGPATTQIYTLSLHDALPICRESPVPNMRTAAFGIALVASTAALAAELESRQLTHYIPQNDRSEEHTSELQSHHDLVCRLLLEKKK